MEMYALIIGIAWVVVILVALSLRFTLPFPKTTAPLFWAYIWLTLALGVTLSVASCAGLFGAKFGSSMMWLAVWGIAWSPISLVAAFLAAGRDCLLPIAYILANIALAVLDFLVCDRVPNFVSWMSNLGFGIGLTLASVLVLRNQIRHTRNTRA